MPLAGLGFLGVRAPFTHSYSCRHSEDWPRPASCHAFLWTLRCNPHTRKQPGALGTPHLSTQCNSLLSDLGDIWTAEAGQEFRLLTFHFLLQTGQDSLWVW